MKQRHIFIYFYKILTGAAGMFLYPSTFSVETLTAAGLALICLLGVQLLLTLSGRFGKINLLLSAAVFIGLLSFNACMYPLCCLLLMDICGRLTTGGRTAMVLSAVLILLLGLIIQPESITLALMFLSSAPVFFIDYLSNRYALASKNAEANREENNRMRKQIDDQRTMAKVTERSARLSERNRLAAHIHDQIGHGISGSILLLEGARLTVDKDPEKAKTAVDTAAQNLRDTVDGIRAALRQERTAPAEAGLAQIAEQLTRFKTEHPSVGTELTTAGDLSAVPLRVWICVRDNLTDTLTNLLKHSTADRFQVSVVMKNKLVTVSFRDNGTPGEFTTGIGLAAMEERCALSRGNCFFTAGREGFSTVMTFMKTADGLRT